MSEAAETSADRHRWLVLVAMTGSLSMITLDQTVVTVALPSMARQLPLSVTGEQWVVNAYVLAMAALVAVGGKLGARFGGVTTFRTGVGLFFLASMACGLAPRGPLGEPWIVSMRALQGAGAALMVPVSAAIVLSVFPVAERGRAMACYAGISEMFLAVGPLLGGVLTQSVYWRVVFWLNVPVGLAALLLVHLAAPPNTARRDARIDARAVLLLVGGLSLTVLAVQQSGRWTWTSPATRTCLVAGVVLTALLIASQLRAPEPLVQIRLLGQDGFLGDAVVIGLVQFGLLATVLYGSLYLQDVLGFSPIRTGLAVLPLILPLTIAAQVGGRWYDRAGVRPPVLIGLAISAAGLAGWAASLPALGYPAQLPGMVLLGTGLGLVASPTNTDALGRAPAADRSQASGLVETIRQLGGTLGVAMIGAIVLGLEHRGTAGPARQHAADAIAVGFGTAATVVLLALIAGHVLLPHGRVRSSEHRAVAAAGVPS